MPTQSSMMEFPESPAGCKCCVHLMGKISDLENRISTLRKICEDEVLLDSMLAMVNGTPSIAADALSPEPNTGSNQSSNLWFNLGARPKITVCSTQTVCAAKELCI